MSFFGGGNNSAGAEQPAISALSIQTAGFGVAMQICWGTNRVSPTLGYTSDFVATAHQSSGGGKLNGGGGGSTTYTYSSTIMMFVCEGEIRNFGKVWKDKDVYADIAAAGFTFAKTGTYPQASWGFLDTNHPTEALAYNGTALVAASGYALSGSATLGNHSIEVAGRYLSATPTDQDYTDAHIKNVIIDFLTNPHFGAIDARTAVLTLDTDRMHDYCRASGFLISPLLSSQKPAHEYLSEWATVANAAIVWSEGQLKFIPYADESFTGNGVTFTADNTIRYAFDDDNIAEPIKPKRKKSVDAFNSVPFECLDRANDYNKFADSVKDQASIEQPGGGLRPAGTMVLDCICLPGIAMQVAHIQLVRGLYIRNEYIIQTWCDADLLEPLDFITLTDAGLGLNAARCRITAIEDDQEGKLTITCEEAPEGVYNG